MTIRTCWVLLAQVQKAVVMTGQKSPQQQVTAHGRMDGRSPSALDMQFQMRRVVSALDDTIWLPEVLKASAQTVDSWPAPAMMQGDQHVRLFISASISTCSCDASIDDRILKFATLPPARDVGMHRMLHRQG